jgi:hypothetical protein
MPRQTHTGFTIAPQFAVLQSNLREGDFYINGPYPTREAARADMRRMAEARLADFQDSDDNEWELDWGGLEPGDEHDWVTLGHDDEPVFEFSVFTMIKPEPAL